ncbi:SDR family oxidoreductase, partial [bacterium]|nr:SDR family oxidoreductase [bacterium]
AIALFLSEKGYDIALHYGSSGKEAREVSALVEEKRRRCRLFQCDLGDMKAVSNLIPEVHRSFPDLSLLVNNASIFKRARFMETDLDLYDRHLNINLKTPFFLSQDFARVCKTGQIINILDTKISKTLIEYFVYALSKKALFEFTKMAAKELGPRIRVNGIAPGLILPASGMHKKDFEKMGDHIPLQKTGDPQAVVRAVDFFIENAFVTGETIFVDGGEHLK